MQQFLFYWQYAARNLWCSRRWAAFAVFSVAAGVATVVALRSLGLAIGDALTSNIRASNHGDITFSRGGGFFFGRFIEPEDAEVFNGDQVNNLRNWTAARGGRVAEYISSSVQAFRQGADTAGRPQFVTAILIDPPTYPPTDDIRAVSPPGVPLRELFTEQTSIVVSENLADSQNIAVGDLMRISGTEAVFTVRGIVPTQAEAGLRDLSSAFFGFVYLNRSLSEALSINPNPNRISIALPEGYDNQAIQDAAYDAGNMIWDGNFSQVTTVPQLLERNARIADLVGRFIVIMGLGAMLLGGVGIINTMLVVVRRRTDEIAALKTFGLKGRQVAALFMAEALLLGLLGSLLGALFGTLLSGAVQTYGETFIQQELRWRIYPEAIAFGFVLGLVVTGVFGVLPVLTAVRVRPASILRPNDMQIPAVGVLQSLGVLLFVVLALGAITGFIIGPLPTDIPGTRRMAEIASNIFGTFGSPLLLGIVGVAGTLAFLGFLVGQLWLVVWLIGRLPTFGWVDLRLALRNMTTRRTRTAITLLALSAGMFALSSITFFGAAIRETLQLTISRTFGGNVLIFSVLPQEVAQPLLDLRLNTLQGVEHRTLLSAYDGQLVLVDGRAPRDILAELAAAQPAEPADGASLGSTRQPDARIRVRDIYINLTTRSTNNPAPLPEVSAGRGLTPEDRGRPVAVVQITDDIALLGVRVGSILQLEVNRQQVVVEVVGVNTNDEIFGSGGPFGEIALPPDVLVGARPDFQLNIAQVTPEHLNNALVGISALPLMFPLDINFVDGLLSRIIDQFSALPILVGLLSLGASAVIMANTVALATLERRRQIGILKAIGLKGRRVLRVMLLENLLVCLLGGVIGIGLSAFGVGVMNTLFGLRELGVIPNASLPVAAALVMAAVLIGSLATFLSAGVAVRERVLNVLRYE